MIKLLRLLPLLGLLLVCVIPSQSATWTMVQHVNAALNGCTGAPACAITISTLGAGNLVTVGITSYTGNSSGTARTISSLTAGSCTGSWQIPAGAAGFTGAALYESVAGAYCLSSLANGITLTVTINASLTGGDSGTVEITEYHWSGSSISLDGTPATTLAQVAGGTQSGQAQTLTGTTDVIVQWIASGGTIISSISGSYTNPTDVGTGYGYAGWINTSSGTAPTWTMGASASTSVASMAFVGNSAANPSSTVAGPSIIAGPSKTD